jgi:carbon-monoxide dehydrogenase medium subunit
VIEALELLARSGVASTPLAGGTTLVPQLVAVDNEVEAVVDLSRLGLDFIELEEGLLRLGATVTLADVADSEICRQTAAGLLSQAARLNAVLNVRNVATVGGAVVTGDPTSELLLALLTLDAELILQTAAGKTRQVPLSAFLRAPTDALAGGLLTEVRVFVPGGRVGASLARIGRTPHDRPIVAATAVVSREDDVAARVSLAMSGVARTPVRLSKIEGALEGQAFIDIVLDKALSGLAGQLNPPGDFRGSAEYRRAMAPILSRRALQEAWAMVMD